MKMGFVYLVFTFVSLSLFADVSATTSDGKTVLLKDDGTWEYTEEIETDRDESAAVGPFGIDMRTTYDQLADIDPDVREIEEGLYAMAVVPSPSRAFETYVVRIHPTEGVIELRAIGIDITTSRYGDGIKSEFNRVKDALSDIYGTPEVVDFLRTGSIWDEPEDWMTGLSKNERYMYARWEGLDGHFENIFLGVSALSSSKGYISLEYYVIDHEALKESMTEKESF